jgi:hypothetical protein
MVCAFTEETPKVYALLSIKISGNNMDLMKLKILKE